VNENKKLEMLEIQQATDAAEAPEKPGVEEIVDANARGGLLVLNPGFRYAL
jgi:hypothetical protein